MFHGIYLPLQFLRFGYRSIKPIEKLSSRHLKNSGFNCRTITMQINQNQDDVKIIV